MHGFWQRKAARPCTFLCMSGSARFRGVQVLSLSGSGKDTAEGRGITLYEGQMKYLGVKKWSCRKELWFIGGRKFRGRIRSSKRRKIIRSGRDKISLEGFCTKFEGKGKMIRNKWYGFLAVFIVLSYNLFCIAYLNK